MNDMKDILDDFNERRDDLVFANMRGPKGEMKSICPKNKIYNPSFHCVIS